MCRSIKTLFNFEPPATDEEVRAASLQFVRKLSGFNAPSRANQAAFDRAVAEIAASARALIESLVTTADSRDRDVEAARARARFQGRSVRDAGAHPVPNAGSAGAADEPFGPPAAAHRRGRYAAGSS